MQAIFRQLASLILPITALILVPLWVELHWHAAAAGRQAPAVGTHVDVPSGDFVSSVDIMLKRFSDTR